MIPWCRWRYCDCPGESVEINTRLRVHHVFPVGLKKVADRTMFAVAGPVGRFISNRAHIVEQLYLSHTVTVTLIFRVVHLYFDEASDFARRSKWWRGGYVKR